MMTLEFQISRTRIHLEQCRTDAPEPIQMYVSIKRCHSDFLYIIYTVIKRFVLSFKYEWLYSFIE